jgi:hypothetical protein
MTAGVFASVNAQPIGLWSGLARIFEALELMSEHDQELALEYLFNPEESKLGRANGRHLTPVS